MKVVYVMWIEFNSFDAINIGKFHINGAKTLPMMYLYSGFISLH